MDAGSVSYLGTIAHCKVVSAEINRRSASLNDLVLPARDSRVDPVVVLDSAAPESTQFLRAGSTIRYIACAKTTICTKSDVSSRGSCQTADKMAITVSNGPKDNLTAH